MSGFARDMRLLTESYLELHRDPKKRPEPFDLWWPYPTVEQVTEDERAALTEQLIRRSALADR